MKSLNKVWAVLLITCLLVCSGGSSFITQAANADNLETEEKKQELTDVRKAPKVNGTWKKKGKSYTFQKTDGTYAKNEWLKIKKDIYYFNQDGCRKTGWFTYHNKRYYFNAKGQMHTGWLKKGGKKGSRYYFKESGAMVSAEWIKKGKRTYYLKSDGKMAKGWLTLGTKKYYFESDGTCVKGAYFIKGKGYYFNKEGIYIPSKKVKGRGIDPKKKMIALTFDDGPGPYTNRLLNCLKKNNAVATFFVVGNRVSSHKSTVKKAYKMGCEIGNHSWDHPQLTRLSASGVSSQIKRTDSAVKAVTGKKPTLLRPPYGAYNSMVAGAAQKPIIMWDVDTLDWKTKNAQSTINSTMHSSKDGSIVLMHDIHYPTVAAAEKIIPRLIKKGYQLVTVSELAKYKKTKLRNGKAYSSIEG